MKVLLIFPPLWIPYRPYLSTPSLSAYLKSNGITVVQKDFNIEAYNLLLSERYLKDLAERLQNQFNTLDSKSALMPGIEQRYYSDLFKSKSSISYIAEQIEKAKGVFKNKHKFYDIDALSNARNILEQAQAIISTGCFPSGQDLIWPINMRLQRSIEDIHKLTQNRAQNPFLELYEHHLLPFIHEQDPDIIGISVAGDSQLVPALTLSRLIKSRQKKAHVVVGGYVITLLSDILLKYEELFNLYFDSAVLYEGERPLLKLVENISDGQTLEDVPNLIYLDHGKIRANEVLPSEKLNSLPTPCFDGLPLDSYLSPEPVLPILSSRGCYWGKCAFCSHCESYGWQYQNRDASKVVDDMQKLSQEHGVTHFAFSDEGISPSSMHKISDELIKRRMEVRCSTNARFERQFTPELCEKMFKAGFRIFYWGLESGCNRVLNHMEKGITKETAVEVCQNTYDAGIWNHVYVFFGFPTETREEAQETIDFLLSNKKIIHSFNIGNFTLSKGSATMKYPERYGIRSIDTGPNTDFNLTYNHTVSSGLTFDEALELSHVYQEEIVREYRRKGIFKLYYEDILLYLSHFERSDPYLRSVAKVKTTKTQPNKELTKNSVPRIKPNVALDKLRFNIVDIAENIADYINATAFPGLTSVIFDPVSGKVHSVNQAIEEILALCDGKKSVQQIAHELSQKYDAPRLTIEEDCIAFLKSLSKEGYVLY